MYWYLAENCEGKRGVMPINFVQVGLLFFVIEPLLHIEIDSHGGGIVQLVKARLETGL